jgi:ABC-type xylose transport system permease subunit
MVQNGHSLGSSIVIALLFAAAFGLVNGWLIAFADVPSLFATLATGIFVAGLGQAFLFQLDVVQWSPGMEGFQRLGQGSILGVPTPIVMFAIACAAVDISLPRTATSSKTAPRRSSCTSETSPTASPLPGLGRASSTWSPFGATAARRSLIMPSFKASAYIDLAARHR